jgi:hypothetical protein
VEPTETYHGADTHAEPLRSFPESSRHPAPPPPRVRQILRIRLPHPILASGPPSPRFSLFRNRSNSGIPDLPFFPVSFCVECCRRRGFAGRCRDGFRSRSSRRLCRAPGYRAEANGPLICVCFRPIRSQPLESGRPRRQSVIFTNYTLVREYNNSRIIDP